MTSPHCGGAWLLHDPAALLVQAESTLLYIVFLTWLLFGIRVMSEEYLAASIQGLIHTNKIPQSVAGAMLMAAGSSAPKAIASLYGVLAASETATRAASDTIFHGSTRLNQLAMVGFCILASPMQLQMHLVDMIRDMGLYAISVILLVVIFNDEWITTIESWIMAGTFLVYSVIRTFWTKIEPRFLSFFNDPRGCPEANAENTDVESRISIDGHNDKEVKNITTTKSSSGKNNDDVHCAVFPDKPQEPRSLECAQTSNLKPCDTENRDNPSIVLEVSSEVEVAPHDEPGPSQQGIRQVWRNPCDNANFSLLHDNRSILRKCIFLFEFSWLYMAWALGGSFLRSKKYHVALFIFSVSSIALQCLCLLFWRGKVASGTIMILGAVGTSIPNLLCPAFGPEGLQAFVAVARKQVCGHDIFGMIFFVLGLTTGIYSSMTGRAVKILGSSLFSSWMALLFFCYFLQLASDWQQHRRHRGHAYVLTYIGSILFFLFIKNFDCQPTRNLIIPFQEQLRTTMVM